MHAAGTSLPPTPISYPLTQRSLLPPVVPTPVFPTCHFRYLIPDNTCTYPTCPLTSAWLDCSHRLWSLVSRVSSFLMFLSCEPLSSDSHLSHLHTCCSPPSSEKSLCLCFSFSHYLTTHNHTTLLPAYTSWGRESVLGCRYLPDLYTCFPTPVPQVLSASLLYPHH